MQLEKREIIDENRSHPPPITHAYIRTTTITLHAHGVEVEYDDITRENVSRSRFPSHPSPPFPPPPSQTKQSVSEIRAFCSRETFLYYFRLVFPHICSPCLLYTSAARRVVGKTVFTLLLMVVSILHVGVRRADVWVQNSSGHVFATHVGIR